jgi:hypothetical protein
VRRSGPWAVQRRRGQGAVTADQRRGLCWRRSGGQRRPGEAARGSVGGLEGRRRGKAGREAQDDPAGVVDDAGGDAEQHPAHEWKTARSTRPRPVLQPAQTLGTEPSSSVADAIGMTVQTGSDLDVGHPRGRIPDRPRALHIPPRRRDLPRTTLKLVALPGAQLRVAARPGRDHHFATRRQPTSHNPEHGGRLH